MFICIVPIIDSAVTMRYSYQIDEISEIVWRSWRTVPAAGRSFHSRGLAAEKLYLQVY